MGGSYLTDYTFDIQPSEYQIVVESENTEPVVIDYPSTVLNVTVDPHPASLPISVVRYIFMIPVMEWAVNHNKNTTFVQPLLFTLEGRRVVAQTVATSANTLSVYFTCPQAGYMDVIFGSQAQTEVVYVN